jgi:hypothetical protein
MELNTAGLMRLSCDAEDIEAPIVTGDNDPRMADDRYPTAHHISHEKGGDDEIENQPESSVTDLIIDLADRMQGDGFFGDGSDGDVTLTEDTTLARDMFYDNLTVPEGITLYPNGFRIFVKDTLTNNGTIDVSGGIGGDGGLGSQTHGNAGDAGSGTESTNYLPYGQPGTVGHTVGSALTNAILDKTYPGSDGGVNGSGYGGIHTPLPGSAAGDVTLVNGWLDLFSLILGRMFLSGETVKFNINGVNGGSGYGGGQIGGGYGGGGAGTGGNGGYILICAKTIIGNGSIIADGGKGGTGGTGSDGHTIDPSFYGASGGGGGGGGGTGGNGGLIFLLSLDISAFTGHLSVCGGEGGTGGIGGTGGNGVFYSQYNTPEDGAQGGYGGVGGQGGAGGIIIVNSRTEPMFTYSINNGNGGVGGIGGNGGTGNGGVVGGTIQYATNGAGGNGGKGGDGYIGGTGGQGGISPPSSGASAPYSLHGEDGDNGSDGESTEEEGDYSILPI